MGMKKLGKDTTVEKNNFDKPKKNKKQKLGKKALTHAISIDEIVPKPKLKTKHSVDNIEAIQQERDVIKKKRKKHRKSKKKEAILLALKPTNEISKEENRQNKPKKRKNKESEEMSNETSMSQPIKKKESVETSNKTSELQRIKKKKKPKQEESTVSQFNKQSPIAVAGKKKKLKRLRRGRRSVKKPEADAVKRIVIVENIPIKMLHTFKGHFEQRFSKYGIIHHIGACEFDETTAHKEFKTSIVFNHASSATKALEEDNLLLEGSRLCVRMANEAKDTTLVVRKIREFNEKVIRSIFGSCGPIRRINCVKKPEMDFCTVFVEFWKPESLKDGLNIAKDVKIGGRKLLVGSYDAEKKLSPAKKVVEN